MKPTEFILSTTPSYTWSFQCRKAKRRHECQLHSAATKRSVKITQQTITTLAEPAPAGTPIDELKLNYTLRVTKL